MGKGSKKKSTEQNDLQLLQALQQQTSVLDNAVNNGWYDEIPVLQNQGATNVAPFSRPNTSQRDEEHNAFVQNKNASRMTQAEKDARSGSIPVLENMTDKDREKVSNLQKQQDYYNNFSTGDAGVDEAMGTSIADSNKRKQNKIDEIQNQKLASSYDDDATIDEWLGREMTDSEVESAKKLVNDYEKQNINAITPEQKRKAEQMSALKDKTSKVESAIYGSMNATPGVDALLQAGDKQYYGWTNEDLANEVKIKNPTLSQEQTDAISQIDEQINALKESKPLTTGDVGVDEAEAMKHANDVTEKVKNLERQKYIVMLGDQFDDSYGYKARKEDAQEQNMGSYLAGDMATRVAETALVQSALKGTGIENTLEGVFGDSIPGKIATDVTKDMPVDVLTDTLPEYLSNKASGMSDDEVNKRLVMNLALNLGINVGVAGLQNLDEIKQAIRTTLPEKVASGEVTEDVAKQIEEMVDDDYLRSLEELTPEGRPEIPELSQAEIDNALSSNDVLVEEAKKSEGAYKGRKNSVKGKILDDVEISNPFGKKTTVNDELNTLVNMFGTNSNNEDVWALKDLINQFNQTGDERFYREAMRMANQMDESFAGSTYVGGFDSSRGISSKNHPTTYTFGEQSSTFSSLVNEATRGRYAINMPNTESVIKQLPLSEEGAKRIRQNASILGNVNSTKEQVDQAYRDLIDTVRKENIDKESQSLIMDTIQSERDGIEGMIDGVSDKTLRDAPEIPRFDGVEEETQPITTLDERYQNIADNVSEEPRTTVNLPEEPIKQLEPDDPKLELSKARSNTFERDNISDTFQKLEMDEDIYLYAKQEEKASLEQAAQKLQDFDACEKEYLYGDLTDKEMGAVDGDTMFGMYKKYCNDQRIARQNGDTELANALQSKINAITKKIQVKGTKAGQFIQSFAKYTRDSDGVILQADILNSKRAAEIASSNPRMAGQAKDFVDDLTKTLSEEDYLWGQLEGSIPLDDSIDITEGVSAVRTKFSEQDAKIRLNQEIQKAIGKVKNKTLKKNLTRNIDQMTDSVYKAMKEGEDIYDTLARYEDIGMTGSLGLTDEARDTVQDLLYKAQSLPYESKERVDLEDEAFSIIADSLNVTGTWKDKINSMRYFAMLFNPKTHLRNITGNVSWQGITDVKDNLAAVIEGVVDKATKGKAFESTKYLDPEVDANRTKSILNRFNSGDRELLKSSKENADRVYRRLVDGNKYYSTTSSIESNKKVFKSNVLNKLTDFNGKALNKEDELALYSKYSKSLAGYLKANGVDSSIFSVEKELDDLAGKLSKQGTDQFEFYSLVRDYMDALKRGDDVTELVDTFDDMVKTIDTTKTIDDVAKDINNLEVLNKGQEYAINEAKKAAFHQESKLADALGEFSRKMGDGNAAEKAAHIAIEGTLPFKKTPINILKSAAAYSPLEGAKVLKDIADLHAGRISANTLIDDISKGLTGTGLLVSGALLSKAGILKATDTSDGTQEYSIKVGNGSYTIDNFAPTTLPLLVGASYNETLMNNKGEMDFEDFLNAMTTVSDPLVETTMLQGISNLFKSVSQASSNDEKPLPAFAATVGSNYLTQFVPTELGNIARSIDDTRRSTYTGKKGIANLVGKTINSAKNKIPVLSETSQPYINAWGREEKNVGDNFAERFAYQHLSGGYYQDIDNSPRAVESRRIAEMFGEDYANDGVSTSVYLGGSKHKLTPEELTKYATEAGQAKATIVDALIKSEGYKNSTDQQKADLLKQAYQLGNDIGKSRTFPDYAVDKSGVFDYEDGNIKGIVDDMLTTAMNNAEKDNLKSEGLPVNDTVRRAYQNNDEQTLDTWRAVQEITQEYDHSDANETLVKRYINGGAESVNQYLEAKDTLQSKYGIDSSSEKLINAVVNNDTEYLNTYSTVKNVTEKYGVGTNDTTMGIYNTDGEEGIKKYGEAQQIVENEYGDDMTKKMYDAYNEGGREGLDTYLTLKTYAEDNELSLTEGMQKVYANMSDKGLDTYKGIMQNEHPKDSSKGNDAYDNLIPYLQASGLSTKEKGQMIYSLKEPNKSTQQYFDSENYSKIWEFYRKKYLKK